MKIITLLSTIAASILLTACANTTTQQTPGLDHADQLFLKYVEIAQRPSVLTADDMTEINHLTGVISSRKTACETRKNEAMRQVRALVLNDYKYGIRTDDMASTHGAELAELKKIQATAITSCDGHGFPQGTL